MRILGISAFGHDSAAALIWDGKLVAAVEEERFSGRKHDGSLPREAATWCVAQAGGVDALAFYHRPFHRMTARIAHALRHLPGSLRFCTDHGAELRGWWRMMRLNPHRLGHALGLQRTLPLLCVEHHRAHAWDALVSSPFESCAILSVDGMGEWTTTWAGSASGRQLQVLRETPFPHSLGIFWEAVTQHLGFRLHADEFKVMGLAAYGQTDALARLRPAIELRADGGFRLNLAWFRHQRGAQPYASRRFTEIFGPPRQAAEPLLDRHLALAASAQALLEEAVLHQARALHRQTGMRDLCLTGGVALNSKLNGRLLREGPFERIHVPLAPHDAGTAVGAARAMAFLAGQPLPRAESDPFLGPSPPSPACGSARGVKAEHCDDPVSRAAECLAEGAVIGWFQGAMEFGPRALGNRSILADPRQRATRDRINHTIKGRESFRPLAPAILAEHLSDLIEGSADCTRMSFALPVRSPWRSRLGAITHEDGSARVQSVRAEDNPLFRQLLEAFYQRTGIPALVNTSLNVAGQPLARTPADALRVLVEGDLDALFCGQTLLRRAPVADPALGRSAR